jgi:hypothetical protein
MTTNRNYATDYVIHAHELGAQCSNQRAHDRIASEVRSDVTCKRCLASLTKRDRAFQRKALRRMYDPYVMRRFWRTHDCGFTSAFREKAARAIAAEEGRAL